MTEPTGVVIHDQQADTLRTDARWTVVDADGRVRELVLRVGRGYVRDAQASKGEA